MQENLNGILSQQLRDVHLPAAVGWWPPAIGWWMLAGTVIAGLLALLIILLRKRRKNRYRKIALAELQDCFLAWQQNQDTAAYLQSANSVLKRSMMCLDNGPGLVSLHGKPWVNALNKCASTPFSAEVGKALAIDCYRPKPDTDIAALHQHLAAWLRTHRNYRQLAAGAPHA